MPILTCKFCLSPTNTLHLQKIGYTKKALSPKEALTIIYQDVKEGKIHPLVFKALINYVDNMSLTKVSQA